MNKRQWRIRRSTIEVPDAERRWDRAYQQLLQRSAPSFPHPVQELRQQEKHDEYCRLRPRFDATTNTNADD